MAAPAVTARLELGDIQGLVARGYADLVAARYLLLAVDDPTACRRWLASLVDRLTDAATRPDRTALNLAFTSAGLATIGLPEGALAQFSHEFVTGMTDANRQRILGDTEESAPERWSWGGPGTPAVHAVLMLFAVDDAALSALCAVEEAALAAAGVSVVRRLDTTNLDGVEHFGFRDGISQPIVEGLSKTGSAPPGTVVRAGEFVLGYPNEYGLLTDRPLLEPAADPGGLLPRDAGGSGQRDLGRNGSYLVFRQLAQDVRGFWQFLDGVAQRSGGGAQARTALAAKMVGRWPSGASLVLAPEADDPALAERNDFAYHAEDELGYACPLGAHVRRANPRDSLDPSPGTEKSLAINRRHRILRRGREYGPALPQEQALEPAPPDDPERGIYFICLNANLARQFEFVQHTWVNNHKFAGLYDDADPLVGPRCPHGATFTMPAHPVRRRITGLPRFVTTRGGAYFFLPGIRAVRYLASLDAG
ncbi:MAG TPA: Dyp-type peroxidase [Chloroflexota bacterium]|nr:Dyp-type peroxidase [Chloroflexota bacterium]